jgi:hypothetical protein
MTAPVVVLTVAEARNLVRQLGRWPNAPLCGARIRVITAIPVIPTDNLRLFIPGVSL